MPQLAQLAVAARLGEAHERDADLAERFLEAIEQLNRDLAIPTELEALREQDISEIARGARAEADSGYPVPRYMGQEVCETLIRRLLPKAAKPAKAPAKKVAKKKSA